MAKVNKTEDVGDAPDSTRNIYQRIMAITGEMGKMLKTGTNDFQKYKFQEASVLTATLKPLFVKHGVAFIPEILENTARNDGTKMTTVTAKMRLTFVNVDDPADRIEQLWYGEGGDTGDKAMNKAGTSGVKYALMKMFFVSDKDDPDAESPNDTSKQARQDFAQARQAASRPAQSPVIRHVDTTTGEIRSAPRPLRPAQPAPEVDDAAPVPATPSQVNAIKGMLRRQGKIDEAEKVGATFLDTRDAGVWIENLQQETAVKPAAERIHSVPPLDKDADDSLATDEQLKRVHALRKSLGKTTDDMPIDQRMSRSAAIEIIRQLAAEFNKTVAKEPVR